MVNALETTLEIGENMAGKTATEAARELGVSRPTFFKWIDHKKVKATKMVAGTKTIYRISDEEYVRIKGLLVNKRKKGKSILKAQD